MRDNPSKLSTTQLAALIARIADQQGTVQDGATVDVPNCPLLPGEGEFLAAIPTEFRGAEQPTASVAAYNPFGDPQLEATCLGSGYLVLLNPLDGSTSASAVLSKTHREYPDFEFSKSVDFLGGTLTGFCHPFAPEGMACGGLWAHAQIAVSGQLSGANVDPQMATIWFQDLLAAGLTESGGSIPTASVPTTTGHLNLRDSEGYTFDLDFTATLSGASSDRSDSPPGETIISVPFTVDYSVTNTTAQRNAPLNILRGGEYGGMPVVVAPVYPKSSPVCDLDSTNAGVEELTFAAIGQPAVDLKPLPYCFVAINDVFSDLADTKGSLADGETAESRAEGTLTFVVPESHEKKTLQGFAAQPTTWLVELPQSESACYWDWAANDLATCPTGATQIG